MNDKYSGEIGTPSKVKYSLIGGTVYNTPYQVNVPSTQSLEQLINQLSSQNATQAINPLLSQTPTQATQAINPLLSQAQAINPLLSQIPTVQQIQPIQVQNPVQAIQAISQNQPEQLTISASEVEKKYRQDHEYDLILENCKLFSDEDVDKVFDKMREPTLKHVSMFKRQVCQVIEEGPNPKNPRNELQEDVCYNYATPLNEENEKLLRDKLVSKANSPKSLTSSHTITANDLNLTENNIISDPALEKAEASKIMMWVNNELVLHRSSDPRTPAVTIFGDLMQYSYRGSIYICRAGINHVDVVRTEAIPGAHPVTKTTVVNQNNKPVQVTISNMTIDLKYFGNFLGKPLSRTVLMSTVASNNLPCSLPSQNQSCFPKLSEIGDEALKLLSIENFICLQPQPRYLLYTLKRLIIAWYTDIDLSSSILKIKVLINHYRARRDIEINKKIGVQPMIQIFLRYGDDQLDKAFTKLNYYFTNFINMGWEGNDPDYFCKFNSLLYYCNGDPDVKKFFDMKNITDVYKPYTQNTKAFLKYSRQTIAPFPLD